MTNMNESHSFEITDAPQGINRTALIKLITIAHKCFSLRQIDTLLESRSVAEATTGRRCAS